jgi:putative hydrolase of the HAD superfamily
MITPPRGILFDFGSTLVREDAFDLEAGTEHVLSLAHNPRGLSARDVCALVAELDADLRGRREASWIELSRRSFHRLIYEPYGVTFDRSSHEIELEFWKAATRFSLTEGIQDLLRVLRSRQIPLGVVSNSTCSSKTLSWQVEELGLGALFEFVMSSADYVVRKPHPAIFLAAARKLGTGRDQTWFVGDSPKHDVTGATSAGMVSVLYRPERGPPVDPAPDIEVGSWRELLERLDSL